jgi:signal transduction histidine kinase
METNIKRNLEEQIGAIAQASTDYLQDFSLENVLHRIVILARAQVDAEYAALAIRGEDGQILNFIHSGMSQEDVDAMPHFPEGKGLLKELQHKYETINIPDIQKDPRSVGFPDGHPAMASMLGVPIVSGEKILGQIYLTNKKSGPEFTDEDARLMNTLAAYASAAITNAQLYNHILERDRTLNQQYEDLSLINDLAHSVASSWDIREIMSRTLKLVMEYLEIETGEIFLKDRGGKELRLSLLRGEAFEAFYSRSVFRVGDGLVGKAAGLNKALVVYNLGSDNRILRPAIAKAGFTCQAVIPLQAQRTVVGVMTLSSKKERLFSTRELDFLTTIGTWTGTALQNALLQQQTKHLAVLEERERIGMDLHDGIIQSLYSIGLTLDYVKQILDEDTDESKERLEMATSGINSAITDIRTYISDLRPRQMQESKTFSENLGFLINEFETNSKISTEFLNETEEPLNITYQEAVTLFHISQEALSNAARHSGATRTDVNLWESEGRIYLRIQDNGKGFNLDRTDANLGHGLANMERRARKVGGNIKLESTPGAGTMIEVWVPLESCE